jgi:hypothetical protein
MYKKIWWPLFPFLFLIVLLSLMAALLRLKKDGNGTLAEWVSLQGALIFYFLTFALGRWRWLHMPISNIAELFILFNIFLFFKKQKKKIALLNVTALLAIAADFALHHILK